MKHTPKRSFRIDAETLPDLPGMMLVIIKALRELGGSATNQELDEKVIELEGVTEAEQAYTMASNENQPRVNYYLAWSRTYLKRGGALHNSARGVWALTETGSAITYLDETRAIYDQVSREERERARSMTAVLAAMPNATSIEDIEALLPWQFSQEQAAKLHQSQPSPVQKNPC